MLSSIKPRAFKVSALATAVVVLAGGVSWTLLRREKPNSYVSPQSRPALVADAEVLPVNPVKLLNDATDGHCSSTSRVNALLTLLQGGDEDAIKEALGSIGELPFNETRAFWESFLLDRSQPAELRATAAEALAHSTTEAQPLLRDLAVGDPEPDVRAMSAWSLSVLGDSSPYGQELAKAISTEPEADVRRRLYEALLVQEENPAQTILPTIEAETDLPAAVAAMNALGDAVGRSDDAALEKAFDSSVVPELAEIAQSNTTINLRMRAVFALRRASTPEAVKVLAQLSHSSTPQVASAASNGLEKL